MMKEYPNKQNVQESGSSHQPAPGNQKHQKSNRNKNQIGSSLPLDRYIDPDNSNTAELGSKPLHTDERKFSILVDSVPYMITATSFKFNNEIRYKVSFNGSPEHVFTWDSNMGQFRAIDDDASTMPDNLEIAISEKLQSISK